MTTTAGTTHSCGDSPLYEVRLQGHLDSRWASRLEGLALTREADGTTKLIGPIADQAALHGLLSHIRDLGLPIVSIRRVQQEEVGETEAMNTEAQDGKR